MSDAIPIPHGLQRLKTLVVPGAGLFDLCAVLSLLLLLLYSAGAWYFRLPLVVLSLAGMVFTALRRHAGLWLALAGLMLMAAAHDWHQSDNHKYLMGYWCLALFAASTAQDRQKSLAASARLLVALSFLFAAVWKTLSSDYLDSSFFQYSLLLDRRFEGVAEHLAGVTPELREVNLAARQALVNYDSGLSQVALVYPHALPGLARLITWWLFLLELAVGASFLVPERSTASWARHALLLMFILTTYLVAPVTGFGWLLAIMGLAQCSEKHSTAALLYVAAFFLLQIYRAPWPTLLGAMAGGAG